jgi:hypothetical protein
MGSMAGSVETLSAPRLVERKWRREIMAELDGRLLKRRGKRKYGTIMLLALTVPAP